MKSINQLVYSIASIFAIVSACAALPINVTSIDHASELMVGLLALTCISIVILACTCCHRNKSGFELSQIKDRKEFENENTIVDQTNSSSRSEFPIFRAISPPNTCHSLNNVENSLDNRILSNIVNQNHMNRTFNEFENSQNNNGPISVVDMENIQNNNAMDYIPNRNEINITIEPSPHSMNRNFTEATHDRATNMDMVATTSRHMDESMSNVPLTYDTENINSGNTFAPCYPMNEFNAYPNDDMMPHFTGTGTGTGTASESLNNYIDLEDDDTEFPAEKIDLNDYPDVERIHNDNRIAVAEGVCHRIDVPTEACEPVSHPEIDIELDSADDDAISVEEALRALDFAISGGESLLSDYQDNSSSDDDMNIDAEDEPHHDTTVPIVPTVLDDQRTKSELDATQSKCTGLIETVDAKDKLSVVNDAELNANNRCDIRNVEHSREYVYEIAKELVDSVLEEGTEKVALITAHPMAVDSADEPFSESHTPVTADSLIAEPILPANDTDAEMAAETGNEPVDVTNLDDSMDETFVIGKLEASTPCHKTNVNFQRQQNHLGVNLFQTLDEVNESALSSSGIEPLDKTQIQNDAQIAYATFQVQPNENLLATTFVKDADKTDKTFVTPSNPSDDLQETFNLATCEIRPQNEMNEVPSMNPMIKIDKEEANSDDLTTQTPMNTPIELNYVGESWNQFVSKSMNNKSSDLQENGNEEPPTVVNSKSTASIAKNSWFLHTPTSNDTFDINDIDYKNYDGMDEDSESIEENPELLSLTFDALRKQLAESLPQASVRPSVDYSDDEDNGSDSDPDCDNLEYHTRFENPKSEVVINYKQQLSPILEESEDETCKTFVMNETKFLDSTSTGCIDTSEAIMGVTKVLMASNDTLFNFEDTLGDREDMLSPRNAVNSGSNTVNSITPQPDNCKTPTNEGYLAAYPVEYKPNDLNAQSDNHLINDIRPNSLQLNIENLTNNLGDLLSPEQPKTFSEEINTIEQLSSDLSATIDATNTLDDLKTCISVHMNDDMNDIKFENSQSDVDAVAIEPHRTTSPIVNGCKDIVENSSQTSTDTPEPCVNDAKDEISTVKSSEHLKSDTTLNWFEPIESVKENTSPNLECIKIVTKTDPKTNLEKSFELNEFDVKIESQPQQNSEQNQMDTICEPAGHLSGEEDPWATHPITDIRFTGPNTNDAMQQMTGTFPTNDWDSDIEDSNSSEEFLYAKGVTQIGEYLRSTQDINYPLEPRKQIAVEFDDDDDDDDERIDKSPIQNESSQETGDEQIDAQDIWNSHEDLIAVTTNADVDSADDVLDESSISENENEWKPSSWDSLAKPVRSALKSPDKSSSKTGTKSRRSVVFKKQSYQSVYEYPKESASLSPTQSDRQGWANYLANSSPFSSSTSDSYLLSQQVDEPTGDQPIDFNALNGFAVSSSSRPFHLSQFGTDCHTWPTESEFSWSQIQSDKEQINSDISQSAEGWSPNLNRNGESSANSESSELRSPNSMHRPDSGVGELTEPFSESLSFGDLCHTKASLRLPLNVYTAGAPNDKELQTTMMTDDQNELSKSLSSQNDYSENVVASDSMDSIVPTSCTGSMDSINSFDGGKSSQNHLSNSTNADGLVINETDIKNVTSETVAHNDITTNPSKKCDYRTTANRQSDSTDEDSGIENIVRVTKEI